MDVEALITAVERRKTLYDRMSPGYNNRNYVNAEWKKIAEEVGCDERHARRKWKKLRDYFQRNHRVMTSRKPGSAVSKNKKWYLYDRMLFILPYVMDRHSFSSTSTNMLPISSDEDGVDEDRMSTMSQTSSASCNVSQFDSPTPISAPLPTNKSYQDETQPCDEPPDLEGKKPLQNHPRKRIRLYPQDRASQLSDFESEELQIFKATKRMSEENAVATVIDEDELFFKHLVPKMKLLSTIDKMECQAEIHMVVLKYLKKAN